MLQYLTLVEQILDNGIPRMTRTGERTIGIFGAQIIHDMESGFPILTTKYVPFKAVIAELRGFIAGADSAATFRELGTKIWDANANDPGRPEAPNGWLKNVNRKGQDDLGRIYGVQWRAWRKPYPDGDNGWAVTTVDQLEGLIDGIRRDPFGRRHIVSAWNPGELDQSALPPCHVLFQCYVNSDEHGKPNGISLQMYQRSVDVFLGLPFNIASYGLLLEMIAHVVGLPAKQLILTLGDTHIYESHIPEMLVQSRRTHSTLPTLQIGMSKEVSLAESGSRTIHKRTDFEQVMPYTLGISDEDYEKQCISHGRPASPYHELDDFNAGSFELRGYNPQSGLKGKMSV